MFNNVLVGVDGGPNGRDAIALASQLTDTGGKLTLAYVQASVVAEDRDRDGWPWVPPTQDKAVL